jgi:hypothetical protein
MATQYRTLERRLCGNFLGAAERLLLAGLFLSEQRSGNHAGLTSSIAIASGEPRISRTAA